jgi:hypothetical protein
MPSVYCRSFADAHRSCQQALSERSDFVNTLVLCACLSTGEASACDRSFYSGFPDRRSPEGEGWLRKTPKHCFVLFVCFVGKGYKWGGKHGELG